MFSVVILAVAYFGFNFDPAMTNVATESRIYPITPVKYRMVRPDGKLWYFDLVDVEQGILVGFKPWVGVVKGQRIDIWSDPKYTGGKVRTAFTFIAGRLKLLVLDGKKYTFAKAEPQGDLAQFFPERKKQRSFEKNSALDIWRNDKSRLRLWFVNPNSAGMLLAELLLVFVWLLTRTKGFCRVGIGVLAIVAAYGLFATGSRGALLGAVVGLSVFAAAYARNLLTRRGLLILLSALLVFGAGLYVSGKAGRIVNTFNSIDIGNTKRLKIAIAAVKMLADAPTGWHGGEFPGRNACLNWYVLDEQRSIRTHLMSVAECGWLKGWLYMLFWVLMLMIGFVSLRKGSPLLGALWMSFFVGGFFNPVYRDWESWILPTAALWTVVSPDGRLSFKQWRTSALLSGVLSLSVIVVLVVVGKSMGRPLKVSVRSCGKATFINGENPRIWVVGDALVMSGAGYPGREILPCCASNKKIGALAYVYSVEDLPREAETVIVAGRNVPDYLAAYAEGRACKASRLLFLSPSIGPGAVPSRLVEETKLLWVAGSLLAVHEPTYAVKRPWVKVVPGCEHYIQNWTSFLEQ